MASELAADRFQRLYQAIHLIVSADGNAQEVIKLRGIEVAYKNAALAKARKQLSACMLRMLGKHKIGLGGQYLKSLCFKTLTGAFTGCNNALPACVKVRFIVKCSNTYKACQAIYRVGVKRVLNAVQAINQLH